MTFTGADVCKIPPAGIPVSLPNQGNHSEAVNVVPNCLITGAPAHSLNSFSPMTHLDESGTMGGVASGTVMAKTQYINGKDNVLIASAPSPRAFVDPVATNNFNTVATTVNPCQCISLGT
ncbi:PAAR-like domain-containing protein [Burkholderia singularis]|uniref:PAAR-like domain-containing protein n=1 Tax=Burkholderia singularis TaxID=1503053 RepID=UPI00159EE6DB|nr:PAAR-like domain-containing protein [Burkholderia singularis]